MKIIDKLKNALFEEEDEEEEVAKQVDVEKTIDLDSKPVTKSRVKDRTYDDFNEFTEEQVDDFIKPFDFGEETKKKPVIFEEEDFVSDVQEKAFKEIPKKEEKVLYRGSYESKLEERSREKFKPSPVISPVYGVLDKNYTVDPKAGKSLKNYDHVRVERNDKEDELDFDTIRQKAFGIDMENTRVSREEPSLLYEMKDDDVKPEINKITLGDAEEYFDDLGLEYNVDYKATDRVKFDSKDDDFVIEDGEPEEKNLYDLIDLMYDGKDE